MVDECLSYWSIADQPMSCSDILSAAISYWKFSPFTKAIYFIILTTHVLPDV